MVLFISIENFAAVVSDNDGSAFVSKAEFDALKNDFNDQITRYKDSIDNKIDGAIAAYLAGIKLAVYEKKDFVLKSWKKVTQLNYKPSVIWRVPYLNLYMSMNESLSTTNWYEVAYANATITYDRPEANKQVIYMCDAGKELSTTTGPQYVTWKGRAINYKDKIIVNLQGNNTSGYYQGVTGATIYVYYWARFGTGYYPNLNNSASSIWDPRFYYSNSETSSYSKNMSSNWTSKTCTTEVTLEKNKDGDETDYTHIITWGSNLTELRLCDPNWLKHLVENPVNKTDTYPNSGSGLTKDGDWAIMESYTPGTDIKRRGNSSSITAYKASGTNSYQSVVPVVGLLSNSYDAAYINQMKDKFSEVVDNKTYESSTIPLLPDGFPLFAARNGDEIIWEPVFINSKKGTTSGSTDIALYLSVGPMGSESGLKDSNSTRIKDADGNEKFIIKNNKGKITFEMPADGIVYAKWRHEPVYSGDWEITLDLQQCGEYSRRQGAY